MAKSWFVRPETKRVDLPEGQWIEVKKWLTEGERRRKFTSLVSHVRTDGQVTPNFNMVGKADTQSYLVDWSLCDDNGKRVDISDDGKKSAALDNLSPEHFAVISAAVALHVEAMDVERDAEKNAKDGATESSATSPSAS